MIPILEMKKWRDRKFMGKSLARKASKCPGPERRQPDPESEPSSAYPMVPTIILTVTVIPTPCVQALLVMTPESLALLGLSSGATVRAKHWLHTVRPSTGTWGNPGIGGKGNFSRKGAGCWPVCSLTAV